LSRGTAYPAIFLRLAIALLSIEGNDILLAETRAIARRIRAALPNAEMRRRFEAAEPVQSLARWSGQDMFQT